MAREVINILATKFILSGGAEEDRTPDLDSASVALSQAELQPHLFGGMVRILT